MTETQPTTEIRREIWLYQAAKQIGKSTDVLEKELRNGGVAIMGEGKSRSVFVDALVEYQARREAEGKQAVNDDLTRRYIQGKKDAALTDLLTDYARRGRKNQDA